MAASSVAVWLTLTISVLSVAVALARWAGRITALVERHDRLLADHEQLLRDVLRALGGLGDS